MEVTKCPMMNICDIVDALHGRLMEEIEDSNTYLDMGIAAQNIGNGEMAMNLYEIGQDEYTHAKFIHDTMVAYGKPIPDDVMKAWCELENRMAKWT